MSSVYAAKINREHSSVSFQHELITALKGRNLSVDVEELWNVGTINHGEDNSGYVLAVISHLTAPQDTVDVANAERKETLVCGCTGFYFDCFDDQIGAKIDDCKHTKKVKKARKMAVDDNQETLIP